MPEPPALTLARSVARRLRQQGHQAFLVGGCVRDLLLGREPKDFDVATSATPPEVTRLYPRAFLVGAHFGVVLVREAEAQVEVATFRSDHAYHDGRRPGHVEYQTDPRQDVLRRDFTINALLMDPDTGAIHDFIGGQTDLRAGVIRAIGEPEARFREDHLRMLRAVRFAAGLGFSVDDATFSAIARLSRLIAGVSAERVRDELIRILTEGGARRGFELLDASGLLQEFLPEVAALKGVPQPPEFHPEGDVWTHTLLMLDNMRQPAVTLALGVLLHDIAKPPTFRIADRIRFSGHAEIGARMSVEILNRLRFPVQQVERVRSHVASHSRFQDVRRMKTSTLKRFLRMEGFDELLELHRLDCMSSHRRMENYQYARDAFERLTPDEIRPPRLVTGDDLISLGFVPGAVFGTILGRVEDAQLEGAVRTRDEALSLIRREFGDA